MLLADYLRKPSTLVKDADLSHLKDVTESLKILEKVPTARLERLFTEHMDCCSYRLDAWKTGLVQYRLTEQRFQHADGGGSKKGIYLGAYGWLMDVKPGNKQMLPAELDNDLKAIFNADGSKQIKTDSENLGYIHAPSIDQAATAAILRNAFASGRAAGSNEQFAINLRSDRCGSPFHFWKACAMARPCLRCLDTSLSVDFMINMGSGWVKRTNSFILYGEPFHWLPIS